MANYTPLTGEFPVNSVTTHVQDQPTVATISGGRVIVVWTGFDFGDSPNVSRGLKMQMFDSVGEPIRHEFLVNTNTARNQGLPDVTALASGGFAVTWFSPGLNFSTIRVKLYNAAGDQITADVVASSDGVAERTNPAIAGLSNGNFVVTWVDYVSAFSGDPPATGYGTKAQLFDPAGNKIGGDFLVASNFSAPAVEPLASGGFVIAWTDIGGAVHAQRFGDAGLEVGAEILANTSPATGDPLIALLDTGGFVIVWTGSDGDGSGIRGQIFDSAGAPVGGELLINSSTAGGQTQPSVTGLPDGRFMVSWTDSSGTGGDTDGTAIRAQAFNADGSLSGPELQINATTSGSQTESVLSVLPGGDVMLVWTDYSGTGGDSDPPGIKARIFTAAIFGTEGPDILTGTPDDDHVIALGGNDVILVQQGGDDLVEGWNGDDQFYFGAAFTNADIVHGGNGSLPADGQDLLILQGQYGALTLDGDDLFSIEAIVLWSYGNNTYGGATANPNFYSITTMDWNVSPGRSLLVDARSLGAGEYLNFDGSAETDGAFFIYGGAAPDTLTGGAGRDTLDGGAGNDTLAGGGNDDIYFVDHPGDVVLEAVGGGGFDAVYANVNYVLRAGSEIEQLAATGLALGQAIDLTGNEFSQSLVSGSGHDALNGGGGADFLTANAGNDILNGGTGVDYMDGGAGDDIYYVDDVFDTVIEHAGGGNDSVYASATYQLSGGAQVELLATTGLALGQAITLFGNDFAQSIIGATGNDILYGFGGADSVVGNEGNDILDGGGGNDVLRGGLGLDIFQFSSVADSTGAGDIVLDFLTGVDKIDLSLIDANVNVPGNHAFTFIGTNAFSNVAGQLRVESSGGLVNVLGDVNGDGVADLIIHLYNTGGITPLAGDFIL